MVYFPMKRGREEEEMQNLTTMANYLMLFSKANNNNNNNPFDSITNNNKITTIQPSRVFECKTCNRQFPSFQALGGHRASHKKPRTMDGDNSNHHDHPSSPAKSKTHECSICGLEFAIGQALGGHMRRHRAAAAAMNGGKHQSHHDNHDHELKSLAFPVLKRAYSGKRIFGLDLDLNLTPLENEDLEFGNAGKMARLVELSL